MPLTLMVYALIDPRDGAVRYIGKSSSGLRRPRGHAALARTQDKRHELHYCYRWIRQLQALDLLYRVVVLQELECGGKRLSDLERWWIAFARAWGCRLTNLTDGGEGTPGWVPSKETRAKLSLTQHRRWTDPEARARKSAAMRKYFEAPEARAKNSAAMRKVKSLPESRKQHSAALRRYFESPEARAKNSASHSTPEARAKQSALSLKMWASPEARARHSAVVSIGKSTPESRARHSASAYKAWANPEIRARRCAAIRRALELRRARAVALEWGCAL